jgi:hypothetical protein
MSSRMCGKDHAMMKWLLLQPPAPCITAISINRRPECRAAPHVLQLPLHGLDGIRIESGAVV